MIPDIPSTDSSGWISDTVEYWTSGNSTDAYYNTTGSSSHAHHVIGIFDRYIDEMPLAGYPGPLFYVIHSLALVCLFLSTLVGIVLLLYLCVFQKREISERGDKTIQNVEKEMAHAQPPHDAHFRTRASFWKWNSGERFVVYLAIADLGFSSFHILDKFYYVYAVANPPDVFCSMVGFFFQEFMFAQWMLVLFTGLNACRLVVYNKKIQLGRWDWRLLSIAFGAPIINGAITLRLGLLGQTGAWCFIDNRTQAGLRYGQLVSSVQILLFVILITFYAAIWMKIQQTSKLVDAKIDRCNRSANVMVLFVVTFIIQWWSQIMNFMWAQLGKPPSFLPIISGIFVNLGGGVYDCLVYTVIRRRYSKNRVSASG